MSDLDQQNQVKSGKNNNPTGKGGFKSGFDKRRWLRGRGKKSPEQREGDEILRAVIWEELSREFDTATGEPIGEQPEIVDALRLAVRQEIKKKFSNIMERIAGKVTENLKVEADAKVVFEVVRKNAKVPDSPTNPPPEAGPIPGQSSEAEGDRGGTAGRENNGS